MLNAQFFVGYNTVNLGLPADEAFTGNPCWWAGGIACGLAVWYMPRGKGNWLVQPLLVERRWILLLVWLRTNE